MITVDLFDTPFGDPPFVCLYLAPNTSVHLDVPVSELDSLVEQLRQIQQDLEPSRGDNGENNAT